MSFQKIAPAAFLGLVMGAACVYASYPYMMPLVERFAKSTVKENAKVVDKKIRHWQYPTGTFEHEHKRTI